MLSKKKDTNPDDFWREYEENIGEKILSRSLGRYISGWEEFDGKGWNSLWGLIMATTGGFRFHHFPQQSWLDAFSRNSEKEKSREKTIFIPWEKIISAKIVEETKWWVKIFKTTSPYLFINYTDESGQERQITLIIEFKSDGYKAEAFSEKQLT